MRIGASKPKVAGTYPHRVGKEPHPHAKPAGDWRLDRLIDRLPHRLRSAVHWLRQPRSLGIRLPAGVLLICGGVFGFLPILGFWMLPVGLILLADDVPPLRAVRSRALDWIERRHPDWLASSAR
jgi:hypothetical protein